MPESLGMIRRFGDYELLEEIARGGMGVVYRAKQLTLGREVAVKLMLHGALASATDTDRFRAEARNAAALKHPNIINIHEVGEWEGQHYFSMDLIVGQSLDVMTRPGPLSAARAAAIMREVAGAVQHAHEHGILHRDLKPSNVIVDAAGHAHVTDFGLSRTMSPGASVTQAGHTLGTPSFMAPEQVKGDTQSIAVETDVYGLGALLYQLLTGRPPFTGENVADVLRKVVETEALAPRLLNPDVPRDLETICLKCLAKEPQNRYRSVQLLGDDLTFFLGGKPIRARPVGIPGRVVRWSKRNPLIASLGGMVAVLVLALALGSTFVAIRFDLDRQREAELAAESAKRLQNGEKLIEFMLGDLSDKLEPLGHLDILDTTLSKVDKFYSQMPAGDLTPESERNRANLLFQYADIRSIQGHLDESIIDFRKAIAAYEALVARYPRNLQWQYELSRVRNDLGVSYAQKHDYSTAYEIFSTCLKERQALSRKEPDNMPWLASVGAMANNLAVVCRHLNRQSEAGQMAKICEGSYRKWVAAEPKNATARERLAITLGTAGQYFEDSGDFEKAATYYAEKNGMLESLIHDDPLNPSYQEDLAVGLTLVGDLEARRSHFDISDRAYAQGIDILNVLVARDPTNREWQGTLMNLVEGRGRELRASGHPEAALQEFQRVVDFSEKNPEPVHSYPEWRKYLKNSLKSAAEIHRELAARDRSAHANSPADDHEREADHLLAKLKTFPD
jgi:tetratricopeptide (TPR) repeat protein